MLLSRDAVKRILKKVYALMLYKHTTQKLYIRDPQTQLNNFFTLPKISLYVSAPSGDM
jgi:hypothetical protein